jgi:hypothetical protein
MTPRGTLVGASFLLKGISLPTKIRTWIQVTSDVTEPASFELTTHYKYGFYFPKKKKKKSEPVSRNICDNPEW